jgi:hypothetical protein
MGNVQFVVDAAGALWGQVVLRGPDGEEVSWEIRGCGSPDLAVVDALARCQLLASRHGWSLAVRDAGSELDGLLDLVGLGWLTDP